MILAERASYLRRHRHGPAAEADRVHTLAGIVATPLFVERTVGGLYRNRCLAMDIEATIVGGGTMARLLNLIAQSNSGFYPACSAQ